VLTSLARELVTQKGIGERAAAVWRSLQKERQKSPAQAEGGLNPSAPAPDPTVLDVPEPTRDAIELPLSAEPFRRPSRRSAGAGEQLSFGF